MNVEMSELGADAGDAALEAYLSVSNTVRAEVAPWGRGDSVTRQRARMRYGWDGEPGRYFLARVAGEPAGVLRFESSEYDNLDLTWLSISVLADHRRRGIGTALVERGLELSRGMGRHIVGADAPDVPGAADFARTCGFEVANTDAIRVQTLAEVSADAVDEAFADAESRAEEYELVEVVGALPDDLLEAVVGITGAINDAPMGDLDYEDEVFSPDRARAYDHACEAAGLKVYRLLARHRGTGELAGQTVLAVDLEDPRYGHQHDTSVARDHRGHRLGLLLKAGMVRWLRDVEPQVETVDTGNAASNRWMIAVNERLGYKLVGHQLDLQRKL